MIIPIQYQLIMPMGQFGGDGCHLAVVEAAVDRCGLGGRQGGSWNVGAGVCLSDNLYAVGPLH